MSPPAYRCSRSLQGGFTLLEIAVVLIIASLLIGAGLVMVSGMMNDRAVQKTVAGMEAMGVEAVSRAATYRRQQVLSFQKDRCDLYDETGDLIRSVALPAGAQMLIHRYYAKDFAVCLNHSFTNLINLFRIRNV